MRIVHSHSGGRMVLALACLVAAPIALSSRGLDANPVLASSKRLPSSSAPATAGIMRLRGGSPSPSLERVSVSPSGSAVEVAGGGSWAKKLFPVAGEGDDPAGEEREGRAARPRDGDNLRQRSQSSHAVASRSLSKEEESAARDSILQPVFSAQHEPAHLAAHGSIDILSTRPPCWKHASPPVAGLLLVVTPVLCRTKSLLHACSTALLLLRLHATVTRLRWIGRVVKLVTMFRS